jgi:cytochrome c553
MRFVRRHWAEVSAAIGLALAVSGAAGVPRPELAGSRHGVEPGWHGQLFPRSAGAATTGEQIYRETCAGCHGDDGKGAPRSTVGFAVPLPDFTDCNFATRELNADWTAIVRDGGPVRGFSRIMPAFRDLLTPEEIRSVIAYLRTFCRERGWPRGEFNLPLPQVTEKAFPEDEAVVTTAVATRGLGAVSNHLIYEHRFGARDQIEVDVPFGFVDRPGGGSWTAGLGDVSLGPKHVFIHSLASGTILSGAGGVILPTGDTAKGLGTGTTVFEAYVLLGQLLPANSFFQFQGGVELPTDRSRAEQSVFWRGALGTTVPFSQISRIWSPMVELVGARDLVSGAPVAWDVVPQFQISLSALQHVRASVGVSVPLSETSTRHPQILAYVLWDTFDGPLLKGWHGWCPGCQH